MKTQKQLMVASVLALGLFVGGCREAGMTADRETAEVPAGTQLHVRLSENIAASVTGDQERWFRSGDTFQGTLEQDLVAHGVTIAPSGTPVKGRFTDDVDMPDRDAMGGVTVDRDRSGAITTDRDGAITTDRDRDTGVVGRDDRAAGTYDRDRDRIGMELTAIVLHGEDHNIDTHAVPLPPGISAGMSEQDRGVTGTNGEQRQRAAQQAAQSLAGQQFVFTLEDNTDLPATGQMRTE